MALLLPSENASNKMTRALHRILPVKVQHTFRDKGSFRKICDFSCTMLAAAYSLSSPRMVQRFYEISLNLTQYHYGPDSRQFLEFIQPSYKHKKEVGDLDTKLPVVLFVHGGAWGSGRPWMYRLVAQGIADLGFRVALLGYRVYPEADTLSQVSDLALALEWMAINKSLIGLQETNVYISGHSSGAHITAMYLLQCALEGIECPIFISGFIGLSGVYCIYKHYLYEKARGVHEISPMKAANGLMPKFEEHSPSSLARKLTHKQAKMLPPMFLLHGTADETVPFTSTLEFSEEIEDNPANYGIVYVSACNNAFFRSDCWP